MEPRSSFKTAIVEPVAILRDYSIGTLKHDLPAGIAIAALSIPIGVAYAAIAGMPPEAGIYTAVLALVAYFALGSSSHAIIGTDFATVTLFAATVTAAFGRDHGSAPQFMMMITVGAGILMFVAGLLKLGFIANFLSRPIMLGYLNGVSIMLIDSQLENLTGLRMEQTGLLRRIWEVFDKAELINTPTLVMAVVSILFLYFSRNFLVRLPPALVLIALTAIASQIFDLRSAGVAFMPEIHNPLPGFIVPDLNLLLAHFTDIFLASLAVMFVAYTSEIPVVQALSRNSRKFNPNKEFYALGLAHVLIGPFGGYPVSGVDSRTAVNVAVGGKTKFAGLIAAGVILLVVLFVPGVLTVLPLVTMAAIIASAGLAMFERGAGLHLFRTNKSEFIVFAVCVVGVLTFGVYQGMLFAIIVAIIQLLRRSSRPRDLEMGYDAETAAVTEYFGSVGPPNDEILIYRFESALLFYNTEYFVERILQKAAEKKALRMVVIDASPINMVDLTAMSLLINLIKTFNERSVTFAFAGANGAVRSAISLELENCGLETHIFYPAIGSVFAEQ